MKIEAINIPAVAEDDNLKKHPPSGSHIQDVYGSENLNRIKEKEKKKNLGIQNLFYAVIELDSTESIEKDMRRIMQLMQANGK